MVSAEAGLDSILWVSSVLRVLVNTLRAGDKKSVMSVRKVIVRPSAGFSLVAVKEDSGLPGRAGVALFAI